MRGFYRQRRGALRLTVRDRMARSGLATVCLPLHDFDDEERSRAGSLLSARRAPIEPMVRRTVERRALPQLAPALPPEPRGARPPADVEVRVDPFRVQALLGGGGGERSARAPRHVYDHTPRGVAAELDAAQLELLPRILRYVLEDAQHAHRRRRVSYAPTLHAGGAAWHSARSAPTARGARSAVLPRRFIINAERKPISVRMIPLLPPGDATPRRHIEEGSRARRRVAKAHARRASVDELRRRQARRSHRLIELPPIAQDALFRGLFARKALRLSRATASAKKRGLLDRKLAELAAARERRIGGSLRRRAGAAHPGLHISGMRAPAK